MLYFIEQCLNGVQLGMLLFLLAAGLTLIFGIMDLVNLAHGSLYMIGAYFAATFAAFTGSFVAGLALALVATLVVGMAVEVIAMRRLLIGEAREFPELAKQYFERAPGQVLDALAAGFSGLAKARLLRTSDPHMAAAQFAYLVAGEPLDRAVLVGALPTRKHVIACAGEGVDTFIARYGLGAHRVSREAVNKVRR